MRAWRGGAATVSSRVRYGPVQRRLECQLHINVLDLRVVRLTLLHLEQEVLSQTILMESDNIATVSYINSQEGSGFQDSQ